MAKTSCLAHPDSRVIRKLHFFSGCPQLRSQPDQPNIPGPPAGCQSHFKEKGRDLAERKGFGDAAFLALRDVFHPGRPVWILAPGQVTAADTAQTHPSTFRIKTRGKDP